MRDISSQYKYAPVVIHTYTRIEHLKKTIDALLSNDLASQTDLFIASDGPRDEKESNKVSLVRHYIQSIEGFKSLNIILREKNYGFHLNARFAFDEVFTNTDRLITLEDDTIVGHSFLRYINDGLNLYENDKSVFAICGYLHKSISIKHSSNAVLLSGYSPWGYGIWRDRYLELQDPITIANKFLRNPYLFIKMNINRPDLMLGLIKLAKKQVMAVDLGVLLHMIEKNKRCLFPIKSLVKNIGNDGTGVHCIEDDSYQEQSYNDCKLILIGNNKEFHNYPKNPFFHALGGYKTLATNLIKFIILIIFKDEYYEKIRLIKNQLLKK